MIKTILGVAIGGLIALAAYDNGPQLAGKLADVIEQTRYEWAVQANISWCETQQPQQPLIECVNARALEAAKRDIAAKRVPGDYEPYDPPLGYD